MKPLRVHPLWIGSVLGFILLLIVWNCFVPNQAAIPDVIRIGVEDDYVPFSYTDEKGQRAGFDVDISSALCKKLNFRCEILPMPFGSSRRPAPPMLRSLLSVYKKIRFNKNSSRNTLFLPVQR